MRNGYISIKFIKFNEDETHINVLMQRYEMKSDRFKSKDLK